MKQYMNNNYVSIIETMINDYGWELADRANKEALKNKMIDLKQYQAAANVIAKAFLNR